MSNIANSIRHNARLRPEAIALIAGETRLSYRQLDRRISGAARGVMAAGLMAGDRVILVLENSVEWVVAYQAILRAGGIPVPLNPLLSPVEIERIIADCEPAALIARKGLACPDTCQFYDVETPETCALLETEAEVLVPPAVEANQTAMILYSSGSTGAPKGIELSHANLFWNAQAFALDLMRLTPNDRGLAVLPFSHVFGHTCLMQAFFLTGASIVLMGRFNAEDVLSLMALEKITIFMGVPAMYWTIARADMAEGLDLSTWRLCISGGQSLPQEVHNRFESRFGVQISEGYGMTEASPSVCGERLFGEPRKRGSAGQPYWGVELRIVSEAGEDQPCGTRGEVWIRSPGMANRYFHKPELTAETFKDGWLRSGDIGYLDEDGYLFIVDRMKEIIICGGYNVYPREIEELGHQMEGVLEVAAVSVADERLGEKIIAFVVADRGITLDCDRLLATWQASLARYKVPREVRVLKQLPRNATGKIDRMRLRVLAQTNGN